MWYKKLTIFQAVILGFVIINVIGAILLYLPFSSRNHIHTSFIDALFTATSALSVTGSIVVNTATHWTRFGQTIILILVEIGGLGVMTILIFFFFFLGKKMNIRQQRLMQETLNISDLSQTGEVVRYVLYFSLIVQVIGALILSIDFIPQFGLADGIYYSIFHSVSAFCSGGFDLFGGNILRFQNNPLVMLTLTSLIICGGLGFIVWRDLLTYHKTKKLLLHTRFVLTSLFILMSISVITLWLSESSRGAFDNIDPRFRWVHYMFLAISPTTAGFSNVDYNHISMFGIFATIILMFIGGAPGSTAGGVKVTTIGVVMIYLVSSFRNKQPTYKHRSLSDNLIRRSLFIILFGLLLVLGATLILLGTETIPNGFGLEYILMEVVSSFSTAGLSLGLTGRITTIGKCVLIVLMFIGRVGLVTFFWSSSSRSQEVKVKYPEGSILVG
ncbi:ATP synthase subunit J [Erysipelothrix larvae]|uniref:ATP synthase subunit J n=2 Tax=Erysipelothrix larvae TaxID=1514105 RepID=A0A0X8H202_9FIRM|nr:ATP synthase subunit J [Erysipelothrix larvae]